MMKNTTELAIETPSVTEMVFDVGSLMTYLDTLSDPQKAKGVRYQLKHSLTFLILAKRSGEDGMKEMAEWVRLRVQALGAVAETGAQEFTSSDDLRTGRLNTWIFWFSVK